MLKRNRDSFEGFILLESLMALFVFSIITISLIPLIVFMREQKAEREFMLEAGRFSHELIQHGELAHEENKVTAGFVLNGTTAVKDGVIYCVEISSKTEKQYFSVWET